MHDLDDHSPSQPPETDLTDEPQDFRFLTHLSLTTDHPTLPRRGEKDFEPHGTLAQQDILSASRAAMHAALSVPRTHNPKTVISGVFCSEIGEVVVEKVAGGHFRTMGKGRKEGVVLRGEEALYLVERGGLEVALRLRGKGFGNEGEGDEEEWQMSLQAAYAWFIGRGGLTLERYVVYAGLKRSGYIVLRAPGWDGEEEEAGRGDGGKVDGGQVQEGLGVWAWLYKALFRTKIGDPPPLGPLVGRGLYWSYNDIYRRLTIIPSHDPTLPTNSSNRTPAPPNLRPTFHVYKPTPTFRKSAPGPPDFYIAVLNARVDPFPTLSELSDLLECTPYSPLPKDTEGKVYQKLRHGYRNVMIAVVDQGVVSYVRIAEGAFGRERVYESAGRGRGRGGKRGGGGGRGRGRGRGRGG